jgi:undecaprenyl-diphosphatase
VVVWNSRNDWVMFRHDLGHADAGEGLALSLSDLIGFVGGQLGVMTPIVAVLILYLVGKRRREDPLCFWMTVPILAGFVLKSLTGKVQPNWPLIGWLAGVVPLAWFLVHRYASLTEGQKRLVSAGLIIPAIGTLFLHLPFVTLNIPWPEKANPLKKLTGWEQIGEQVSALVEETEKPLFIFSDYYMIASELAFYADGQPRTYCINFGRRMNQYDLWPGFYDRIGENAIYVEKGEMPGELVDAFARVEKHPLHAHDRFGRVIKTLYAYQCFDFRGWEPRPISKY